MEMSIFYPLHCENLALYLLDYEQAFQIKRAYSQTIADNPRMFPQIVVKLTRYEGKLFLLGDLWN